jgi:hypothetical protein
VVIGEPRLPADAVIRDPHARCLTVEFSL